MVISVYLAILFDSWKTITNIKSFFPVFSFFKGNILPSKKYNISFKLGDKNTSFEKNEINFGTDWKKNFVLVYNKILRWLFSIIMIHHSCDGDYCLLWYNLGSVKCLICTSYFFPYFLRVFWRVEKDEHSCLGNFTKRETKIVKIT